jgi:flavorubredoxin
MKPGVTELVPNRLYVLGGTVELDGRVSWAPTLAGRKHFLNCYVLREDDAAMIVDPGPAHTASLVMEQLASVVPPGSPISLYLTRPEFDTFGALGKLAETYRVERIFGGGTNNPFDAFDLVTSVDGSRASGQLNLARIRAGSAVDIKGTRSLVVLRPVIRLLVTYWAYDPQTRTLFTSDSFTHGTTADGLEGRVIAETGLVDIDTVRTHLFSKFWWMPHSGPNISLVADDLRAMFESREIEIIAPSRGAVIMGREVVREHYQLVQDVLASIGGEAGTTAVQRASVGT